MWWPVVRVRLTKFALVVLGITGVGTLGYMVLEGWHFIDSLYMTVITLSTVGFGEVRPLSAVGRLFTSSPAASSWRESARWPTSSVPSATQS
jgi:voltage-gated potassium channel